MRWKNRHGPYALFSSLSVVTVLASFLYAGTLKSDDGLEITFGSAGLASMKWGPTELIVGDKIELQDIRHPQGTVESADRIPIRQTYDQTTTVLTQVYKDIILRLAYHDNTDRLRVDIAVTNISQTAITDVRIDLMHLQFPVTPTGFDWRKRYPIWRDRPDSFPVILADWGSARLAVCSENLQTPIAFGLQPLKGLPYALIVSFKGKSILPRETAVAAISIRAAGAEHPGWSIAHDILQKYAEKYPSELNWEDRRPIGSAFLSTSNAGYKNNPRGWFLNHDLDTNTSQGRDKFHALLMKYEDQVLANCKRMNAQGVIVWDLEGQEMPHATSYLADPRMLKQVAPEMDSIADTFFKRMTDAGLRVGITIRPTRVAEAPNGHGWTQMDVKDPVAEMDQKMSYATKRWGCTLFYLDSNVNFIRDVHGKILNDPAMSAEDFRALARNHKDCLLIPEHKTERYWAYTAPYSELRLGVTSTPPEVREAYPRAFSVMRVVDGPPLDKPEAQNTLAAAIRNGDVLLFRPWWDDPETTKIKQIYDQVAAGHNLSH